MDSIMSLQNLAVTVNGLKGTIELDTRRVQDIMNSNNPQCSEFHARFAQLLNKFSSFAMEYKFDLESLHKLLTNNIAIQQKQREEQERLFQEKLETLSERSSHSLEIVENVQETGYSSTNSMIPRSPSQQQQIVSSDPEPEQQQTQFQSNEESLNIPPPKPIQSRKSIPTQISTKKMNKAQMKSPPKKTNKQRRKKSPSPKPVRNNNNNNKNKNRNNKPQQTRVQPRAQQPKPKPVRVEEPTFERIVTAEQENKEEQQDNDKPYVYNASKVNWHFDEKEGPTTSSTVVYIGNIPFNIKKSAIQFFVIKKAKVTVRHIDEIITKETRNGQFALVRFRYDVSLDQVEEFMNTVNKENSEIKEEKKKAKDAVPMKKSSKGDDNDKKKKLRTGWQTRVFIKYQNPQYHYSYYETEEEMYNEKRATHSLFIKNFDILDKNCHYELTQQLLKFGDLVQDIDIRCDQFGDPYLIVIFKYINDAIYCCNSDIYYKGRRLEIRYSKY